jgi:hypothetical protein
VRASEAYAEAAFLSGRPEQSLMQLQALKRNPALDYVGGHGWTRASRRSPHRAGAAPPGRAGPGPGPPLSAA